MLIVIVYVYIYINRLGTYLLLPLILYSLIFLLKKQNKYTIKRIKLGFFMVEIKIVNMLRYYSFMYFLIGV